MDKMYIIIFEVNRSVSGAIRRTCIILLSETFLSLHRESFAFVRGAVLLVEEGAREGPHEEATPFPVSDTQLVGGASDTKHKHLRAMISLLRPEDTVKLVQAPHHEGCVCVCVCETYKQYILPYKQHILIQSKCFFIALKHSSKVASKVRTRMQGIIRTCLFPQAVRLESVSPIRVRYLLIITTTSQKQESLLLGMDFPDVNRSDKPFHIPTDPIRKDL